MHHVATLLSQSVHIVFVNIDVIYQNLAHFFLEIVEPQKNVRECALAAPRVSNESNFGPSRYLKIKVVKNFSGASRIVESHILELN